MGKFSGIGKLISKNKGKITKFVKDHKDEIKDEVKNIAKEGKDNLKDKVSEKIQDKVSESETNLNEKSVDTNNMGKKEIIMRNAGEKSKKFISEKAKNLIDTSKTDNTAYKQQFQDKLNEYKDKIINPTIYKYLTYLILFINLCCLLLLHFNVNEFYRPENKIIDIKINNNIFYIYSFLLFLVLFQVYILFNIDIEFTTFQKIIEFTNISLFILISYKLYNEILNINNKDCPAPNLVKCIPNNNNTNKISECFDKGGPFQCGDPEYKEFKSNDLRSQDFKKNFYEVPDVKVETCETFDSNLCVNASYNSKIICNGSCSVDQCCISTGEVDPLTKKIKDLFNELIKDDEQKIQQLEDEVSNLSAGSKAGPPGPPGPPGTPGSDARPESSPSTQFPNILCPNEPGGLCKDGQTKCNDKGMCEGFALISLQDKIDLKLKYKDLNSNSYKADNLMNNLETFLLNSLK